MLLVNIRKSRKSEKSDPVCGVFGIVGLLNEKQLCVCVTHGVILVAGRGYNYVHICYLLSCVPVFVLCR